MANWITITTSDKVVGRALVDAGWSESDITERITKAEAYISGKLIRLGLTVAQLSNCNLIKELDKNLARYYILVDIFTNTLPVSPGTEQYLKLKEDVDNIIEQILNGQMELVDNEGNVLTTNRHRVKINTDNVKRALTMDDPTKQSIDTNYSEDDILGNP